MSELSRCSGCGGVVVWRVEQQAATCAFCGAASLSREALAEDLPLPEAQLVSRVTAVEAQASFRSWASASFFHPRDLRHVRVQIRPLGVPAWRFVSALTTHFAGLRPAATRSGKAPVAGVDAAELEVLIPASGGLTQGEVEALRPFHADRREAFVAAEAGPWEPPGVSLRGARGPARARLAAEHARRIAAAHHLLVCNVSPVFADVYTELLLLPVYVGAFRYRERPYRFLVNGQTGEVVGKAPLDRLKIALVVLAGLVVLAAVGWFATR
jgi:hypothetical protein